MHGRERVELEAAQPDRVDVLGREQVRPDRLELAELVVRRRHVVREIAELIGLVLGEERPAPVALAQVEPAARGRDGVVGHRHVALAAPHVVVRGLDPTVRVILERQLVVAVRTERELRALAHVIRLAVPQPNEVEEMMA